MFTRVLNGLLATAALSLLGGCSTPCGAPGGLCAPMPPNTSAQSGVLATQVLEPVQAPVPVATPAYPAASVQTMPVTTPKTAPLGTAAPLGTKLTRIAILLPVRSETLGPPAEALYAGFTAAHERDRDGFVVDLIDTGDSADETLNAYMAALRTHDMIVGPLSRSAVTAVADSGTVSKPTIALNYPEGRGPVPANMLVIGLSIENEARQVARWAGAEHPGALALVVSGPSSWQRRLATAFASQWRQLGNRSELVELEATNGYLHAAALEQLRARADSAAPALMFGALDHDQLRQVRAALGPDLPAYGTSSVNPGADYGSAPAELEGTRMLDLPWQVQSDHSAVMVYPRWSGPRRSLDIDRLYALGIDAFRIAREIALRPASTFQMDGVTGRLSVSFGQGPARFERQQTPVVYQGGAYQLAAPVR